MKPDDVAGAVVDVLARALKERDDRIATLDRRIDALDRRVAAHEASPHQKFAGVWKAGHPYTPGDVVLHGSAQWICKVASPGRPGDDFAGWQLMMKSHK